jgi:hypothetical protein
MCREMLNEVEVKVEGDQGDLGREYVLRKVRWLGWLIEDWLGRGWLCLFCVKISIRRKEPATLIL